MHTAFFICRFFNGDSRVPLNSCVCLSDEISYLQITRFIVIVIYVGTAVSPNLYIVFIYGSVFCAVRVDFISVCDSV